MNLKTALDHVRSKRPIAEPNPGFMIQLKAFEKVIFGTMSDCPIMISKKTTPADGKEKDGPSSMAKEVTDGIQQMKLAGDEEGAKEIEEQLEHV